MLDKNNPIIQGSPSYLDKNINCHQNITNKKPSINKAQQHCRNAQLVRAQTTKSLLQVNSRQIQRNFNLFKKNRKPQQSVINSAIMDQYHKNSINHQNEPQCTSYQQEYNRRISSATGVFSQSLATFGMNKTLRAFGAGSNENMKCNLMSQKASKKPKQFLSGCEDDEELYNQNYRVPSYSERDIGFLNAISSSNTMPNSSIPSTSSKKQQTFKTFQQKFTNRNSNRSSQYQQQNNQKQQRQNQTYHLQQTRNKKLREQRKMNVGSQDQSSLFVSDQKQFNNTNRCEMSASSFGNFYIQPSQNQRIRNNNIISNNNAFNQQQYNSVNQIQTPNSFTSPNGFSTISPINAHSNQNSQTHQISASDQIYTSCFDQKNRSREMRQSNNNNIFDTNKRNSCNPSILYSSMPSSQTKMRDRLFKKQIDHYEEYSEDSQEAQYFESNRINNKMDKTQKQLKSNKLKDGGLQMSPTLAILANTQSTIQQSNSIGNSNPSSFLFQQQHINQKFNQRQSLSGLGITSTTMIGGNQSQNNGVGGAGGGCSQKKSEYHLHQEQVEEQQDYNEFEENKITDGGQNVKDEDDEDYDDDDDDDDDDDYDDNDDDDNSEDLDELKPQSKNIINITDDNVGGDDDYHDDDNVSEEIRFVLKDDLLQAGNKKFYNGDLTLYKSDGFLMRAKQPNFRNDTCI